MGAISSITEFLQVTVVLVQDHLRTFSLRRRSPAIESAIVTTVQRVNALLPRRRGHPLWRPKRCNKVFTAVCGDNPITHHRNRCDDDS